MAGCEAVIETIDGVKYLVIKPKGKATEGIISDDIKGQDFEAIQDKIRRDEASGATLKFEGNVHGYGSLNSLFYDSKIESLGNIGDFDVSNVTDMSYMFEDCKSLESLGGLESWNTSNVTDMSYMFEDCKSIKSLDGLESWNTGNVTNMSQMFWHCDNLTDISAVRSWTFNETKHGIYTVTAMFRYCGKLSNISYIESWADIFYEKSKTYDGPRFMFGGRSSGDSPITLTANWFNKNHTEIFSIFAHDAVFIFNEGNKIDENIVEKFKTDKDIAELLKNNIIITDNANLLDAMKDKKADKDEIHLVTVRYGNAGVQTHIPSVLDSRVNGKVSTDIVEIVKHYIPTAVEEGAKTLRSKNSSVPTDYIAVADKELSSTSNLSDLFQTYTIKAAHTVTFKNENSKVTTLKVEAGKKIADLANETIVTSDAVLTDVTMPDAPAKSGYKFKEWNTSKDGTGTAFTKDTVVNADTTVYAIYTQNPVTPPNPAPDPAPDPTPDPTPDPAPQPGGDTPGGGSNPDGGGSGDKPGNNPNNNPGNGSNNGNNTNGSGDGTGNGNTKNDGNGNGGNNTNGNNTNGSNTNRNRNGGSAGGNGLNAGGSGSNSSNSAKSNDSDSTKDSAKDHSDSSDSAKDSTKDSDKDSKDSAKDSKSSASSSAKSASSSSNIGLIASIVGALAAIAAIIGGFFFFILFGKKRKKRKDEDEN